MKIAYFYAKDNFSKFKRCEYLQFFVTFHSEAWTPFQFFNRVYFNSKAYPAITAIFLLSYRSKILRWCNID